MNKSDLEKRIRDSEEMSFADLVAKIKSVTGYIKSKWIFVLTVTVIAALLGLGYAIVTKSTYTAVCTFVLGDAKSPGLGQYAGLATIAGINLEEGGGGIFQGDNILELYKSRTMIEKALLSYCTIDGKKQLLIDRYINHYNLRSKWRNKDHISYINFNGDPDKFSRKQDSIITDLVDLFNMKILNVTKPDKKLSIIKVEVTTKDEEFSKDFTEMLVQNVNDFYIQTKTKKEYLNIQILQRQADSVKKILNSSINGVASAIDAAPNANPQMLTLKTTSQKKEVDVQANTAIYSEIVKNLELEKISLRQEIPLIQVIDKPVLPLHENKVETLKVILIAIIIALFSSTGILIIKSFFQKL